MSLRLIKHKNIASIISNIYTVTEEKTSKNVQKLEKKKNMINNLNNACR